MGCPAAVLPPGRSADWLPPHPTPAALWMSGLLCPVGHALGGPRRTWHLSQSRALSTAPAFLGGGGGWAGLSCMHSAALVVAPCDWDHFLCPTLCHWPSPTSSQLSPLLSAPCAHGLRGTCQGLPVCPCPGPLEWGRVWLTFTSWPSGQVILAGSFGSCDAGPHPWCFPRAPEGPAPSLQKISLGADGEGTVTDRDTWTPACP